MSERIMVNCNYIKAGEVILVQFIGKHKQKEQKSNGGKEIDIKRLADAARQNNIV